MSFPRYNAADSSKRERQRDSQAMESERLNMVRKKDHSCAGRCLVLWEGLRDTWTEYDNPGSTSCFRQSVKFVNPNR